MSSREARRPSSPSADEPPNESPPAVSNHPNSVMLGPRDRLIGQLYIEGDLHVGGILEGEIEVTGDVEIDDLAKVKASVTARDVSIRGQLVGAVVARKRLEVTRSGSLIGDVRVARLTIQDGATFSGKVSMGAGAIAPTKASDPKPVVTAEAPAKPTEPEVQTVSGSPAPTVPAPTAQATIAPAPAAKTPDAAATAAKAPAAPAPVAKTPTVPTPAAKVPTIPPLAAAAQSGGKDGKAKGLPPKGKPKRR